MPEVSKPSRGEYFVAKSLDNSVIHTGFTATNQVTTTGQPTLESTPIENEHLGNLDAVVSELPPLPEAGTELTDGEIYAYSGIAVMVRQSHTRTEHDPADVPALFLIHRLDDSINWIEGEQVEIGNERTYSGETYRAIQAHVTQAGWEPPNVPALWNLIPSTANWQAGVLYQINTEVMYNAVLYRCRQTHTSQVGWEPPNVLALWLPI